jgi:hypothetical protein
VEISYWLELKLIGVKTNWNLPLSDERREKELQHIKMMARINGYDESIVESLHRKHKRRHEIKMITTLQPIPRDKIRRTRNKNGNYTAQFAILPFYPPLSYRIERVLRKHNINVCYSNRGKLKDMLGNGKRARDMSELSGVYEISCLDCEMKYIGQTRRRLDTRDKEHSTAIKNKQITTSSVAKHCIETGHKRGDIKLLKRISEPHKLDAYESLHITTRDETDLMNTGEPPIFSKLFLYAENS